MDTHLDGLSKFVENMYPYLDVKCSIEFKHFTDVRGCASSFRKIFFKYVYFMINCNIDQSWQVIPD